ncbi:MAG: hypothetical protein PQJ46_01765 [Spirochaetales bacterium]|nr:hypothetical protein [Spirochaetales bacterium]
MIEEHDIVPKTYFKKLVNTDDIWEVRVQYGNDIFRFLGFKSDDRIIIFDKWFSEENKKDTKK